MKHIWNDSPWHGKLLIVATSPLWIPIGLTFFVGVYIMAGVILGAVFFNSCMEKLSK